MRIILSVTFAFVAALLAGCGRSEPRSELRWRFVGGQVLKAQTNAPVLAEVLRLPEAVAVTEPLAGHLAQAWWRLGGAPGELPPTAAGAGATLMRDLLSQLSVGEVVAGPGGQREFALVVHGLGDRAAAWEQSWPAWVKALNAARGGKGEPAVVRKDVWLLAVSDAALLPTESTFRRLAAYPPEIGAVLQFDANFAGLPPTKATFATSNGTVQLNARVTTEQPVPNSLPAWEPPSVIREPLVLFTAVRDLPGLTASLPFLRDWLTDPPPQLFVWGQPGLSIHTYFAARTEDPVATLAGLDRRLRPDFAPAASPRFRGELVFDEKEPSLSLRGALPVAPIFGVLTETSKQHERKYVTFGVIPPARATNALAPEMLTQLQRTNLWLYGWEITADAAPHWHVLGQLVQLLEGRHAVISTPATKWLLAAAPKIGETVTEGLFTGERELTLRRKSPVGLTGLELAALAQWLDPVPPFRRVLTNSAAPPKIP